MLATVVAMVIGYMAAFLIRMVIDEQRAKRNRRLEFRGRQQGGRFVAGDIEVVVDRHNLEVRQAGTTAAWLPLDNILRLEFRGSGESAVLYGVPATPVYKFEGAQHLLAADALSPGDWELFRELLGEVTYGRLGIPPRRPSAAPGGSDPNPPSPVIGS